jgi:formate dehydrogenase major subunit
VVTDRVKGKEVYLPMNDSGDAAINLLTSSFADKDTDTPAYKETQAKLEILKEDGVNPLPRNNFRYGNPHPQMGVQVRNKWARDDYIYPAETVEKERKQHG